MSAQRALVMAPRLGTQPITAVKTNRVQSGAPCWTQSSSPAAATSDTRVTGRSTRRWPCLSTSRETWGPSTAADMAMVAESAPARPYLPVTWEIMVTMPMPIMDSGIRPMKPATENDLVPGAAKIAR